MKDLEDKTNQDNSSVNTPSFETESNSEAARVKVVLSKEEKDRIFEKEFVPHIDALSNFAYHLTYNQSSADDLVQDACLKSYRFIETYQEGTNAKAWLFKILRNVFINEYRKKSKRPQQVDLEEVVGYHNSEEASHVQFLDLRQEIFQGMLGDEVANALNALPVDFRTVVLLCDVEGFTYEEMAKIIDIPLGTVRSRLHRARNTLKESLKKYAIEKGYIEEHEEEE